MEETKVDMLVVGRNIQKKFSHPKFIAEIFHINFMLSQNAFNTGTMTIL